MTRLEREKERAYRIDVWEKAEQREAQRRADELLDSYLTDEQRKSWREMGSFEIVSQSKKRYQILRNFANNVVRLSSRGTFMATYCGGPLAVPIADYVLAQMILLKCNEAHFLSVANRNGAPF